MDATRTIVAFTLILLMGIATPAAAQTLTCLPDGPVPSTGDTDGDGIPDISDSDPASADNACQDNDFDLINELREYQLGTDIALADTDGDGIQDGAEDLSGMNPLSAIDALIDSDGDGFLNAHEALAGTDATSSSSTPPTLTPRAQGRYVYADAAGPNDSWWYLSPYRVFDVLPSNRLEMYPLNYTSAPLAGDYTEIANYALIGYDADVAISLSYPFNPDTGMQVEETIYAEIDYLFPVTLNDGSDGIVIFSVTRVEITELAQASTAYSASSSYRVHAVSDLNSLVIGAGDYAMPVVADPAVVGGFVGETWLYDSLVTINSDGTGTRTPDGIGFTWTLSIDGVLTLDYGIEGATDYHLVDQSDDVQWVAAIHTTPFGESFSMGGDLLTGEGPDWPLPADQGLQYASAYPFTPFALNIRADGTVDNLQYSSSAGEWSGGTSWLWGWDFVGQSINMQRYFDETGNIVPNPADCASQTCLVGWQREQHPVLVRESGSVIYYYEIYRFYDWTDSDQDGVIDTQTLGRSLSRTRKAFRTTRDLDVDGITDSIDTDDDGDSLPDAWERVYTADSSYDDAHNFFTRQNASTDPDRDGLTNATELLLGTDPLTPNALGTSVLLRRTTDKRWFSYDFEIGEIVDQGPLAGLTRNAAFEVVSRADFDGDGQPDVLVRDLTPNKDQNGRWVLYTLQGTTVTSEGFLTDGVTRNAEWELVSDGDFDGDGKADLLVRNSTDGRWLLYLMDSRNIKSQALMSLSEDLTDDLQGTADFNGDGKSDILIRSENGGWLLYEFDGVNAFTFGSPALTSNLQFALQALADFDGDGNTDVLLRRNDGRWFMYLMDGALGAVVGASPALTEATNFQLAAVADFNGDKSADILLRRTTDGRWFTYTMSGTDVVTSGPTDMTRNLSFEVVSTEDFSDDGKANVLLRRGDGRWVLYTMDGATAINSVAPDMTRNTAWVPHVP